MQTLLLPAKPNISLVYGQIYVQLTMAIMTVYGIHIPLQTHIMRFMIPLELPQLG